MSVDPLADVFSGWSPYHYVHNNPIILTDPTGMSADTFRIYGNEEFRQQAEKDLENLRNDPESCAAMEFCDSTTEDINISEASSLLGTIQNFLNQGSGDAEHVFSSETSMRPDGGIDIEYSQINGVDLDGVDSESSEVLYHEISHAVDI